MNNQEIKDTIVECFCGAKNSEDIAILMKKDELKIHEILGKFQRQWNEVIVDEAGPNRAQDQELDDIVDRAYSEIISF